MTETFVAQEGGDHYQAEYQHWDWAPQIRMLYLAGTATKYLPRWKQKNGVEDLKKSKTYLEKMVATWEKEYLNTLYPGDNAKELTEKFIKANNLGEIEAEICRLLTDLELDEECEGPRQSIVLIDQLIAEVQADAGKP